ncbi:PQQ-dependent sugar dehydrogenase [Paenibacillus turpanensis]|uniref:PQQ-dependent sugar dehydrogenase n=1 Tax=Paenibacillus turpanensis TaxID=2689078 RepID=UPI00140A7B73|nr:PQQ-dependent sugar dehydrogenase [Paenibacillus turpanensis]
MNRSQRVRLLTAAGLFAMFAMAAALAGCSKGVQAPGNEGSAEVKISTEVIASGLTAPWSIAFAPDGRIFVTERPGALRVIKDGRLQPEPVAVMPEPFEAKGEGGLLGVVLDPAFAENQSLYLYYTYEEPDGRIFNKVVRYKENGGKAEPDKVLLEGIPGSINHNGGRMRFGPDGHLYITAGDMYKPTLAQQKDSLGGKILRITSDGGIPKDNPFQGSPVYSYGHRNPQGLAWHPVTKELYASEHGQSAHDEINRIRPGANYGWPEIEGDQTAPGKEAPLLHSGTVTWAPSGLTFISSGPWKHRLLAANLRGTQLLSVELNPAGDKVVAAEGLLKSEYGRIRDVAEGPDGSIYFITSNRDGRGNPTEQDDRLIQLRLSKP